MFTFTVFGLSISPNIYGLMYALSFILGYMILQKRKFLTTKLLDDFFMYIFFGVILGGRLGYTLFYNFDYYSNNLLDILKVWEGGMSFHGGVLGVVGAMLLFAHKNKLNFYKVSDELCAILPIGLGLGRLGNYANKELLGYSDYTGPLAIEINNVSYFPSPLLEAFLEGLILYFVLLYFYKHKKFHGQVASMFLIGYGVFRLIVELFFRQPDSHIGYVFSIFSLGSLLSIPMIIIGIFFYLKLRNIKSEK
ncbi:MAG: prolipoprotein diacylglyceryl transferase [Candidatus Gracilibacteria bacterium]|nr:prolipoprotein diacylglyceryl transferase [Candidatus Gracilibacteria bacterium]